MHTDHLIIAVRDLDDAAAAFRRLGFTLTDRKTFTHDAIGLGNHLIYLDGIYLELMGNVDDERETSLTPILEIRQGLAGIAVMCDGVDEQRQRAHNMGFATSVNEFEVHFESDGRKYDGQFRTTRLSHPGTETTWVQIVEEVVPYDRSPFYLPHANGACKVTKTVFAVPADDTNTQIPKFLGYAGNDVDIAGKRWNDGAQEFELFSATDFESQYGQVIHNTSEHEAIPSAIHLKVKRIDETKSCLDSNGVDYTVLKDCLVIPSEYCCGTTLVFE